MANTAQAKDPAQRAQTGIMVAGLLLILIMIFGARRQLVFQQYVTTTANSTAETALIELKGARSPSVEVITQLQHTQRVDFQAEVLTESGEVIGTGSRQTFDRSSSSSSNKRTNFADWPDPENIKVRLTVLSQAITATPSPGITADQVPVIFEVNVYQQMLRRTYLWPALFACIGLWIIVRLARKKSDTWESA